MQLDPELSIGHIVFVENIQKSSIALSGIKTGRQDKRTHQLT